MTATALLWLAVLGVLLGVLWLTGCGPHGGGYGDSFSIVIQNATHSPFPPGRTVVFEVWTSGGWTPGRSWWQLGPTRPGDSTVLSGLLIPGDVGIRDMATGQTELYRMGRDYPADPSGRLLVIWR